jgi:hypothetical protein
MAATPRRVPFPDRRAGRAFNERFTTLVGELLRQMAAGRIPPENSETFYHGRGWTFQRFDGTQATGGVKAHTAEIQLRFDALVEGRLDTITSQAQSIVRQMESHFMRTLYETVRSAVEEVGNVVDAKGKPTPDAFLEMLSKIEFGVNRKGEVTRPEIHLHPDTAPKFIKALEDAGLEFKSQVDRLISKKEEEALAREKERRSRFRPRGEAR